MHFLDAGGTWVGYAEVDVAGRQRLADCTTFAAGQGNDFDFAFMRHFNRAQDVT